jgi:hypothetical protein
MAGRPSSLRSKRRLRGVRPLRRNLQAMSEDVITHAEALSLIDERIGETVYVGFLVARAEPDDPEGPTPFVHRTGTLQNLLAPKPARLDSHVGFYEIGSESLCFPPMAGTIHLRDNGVDFRVADTVSIRVAWRGSAEVGNPPSGSAGPPQLLATGRRAPAEIIEASPTERTVGPADGERRIWSLRLRIHPSDGPAFEATAEHGFRSSPELEAKVERGYCFNMIPEGTAELEVLYDPDERDRVLLCPRDDNGESDDDPKGIRLAGIAAMPRRRSADDDAPSGR